MRNLLIAFWLLAFAAPSFADSCESWKRIDFPEGAGACIGEYELGATQPAEQSSPLQKLLPIQGLYAVAATVGPASCPVVVGFARESSVASPGYFQSGTAVRARQDRALAQCRSAAKDRNVGPDCVCRVIVTDGHAEVAREEFDVRFTRAGARAPATAVAAAPASPAPLATKPAAATPPPTVSAPPVPNAASAAPPAAPLAAASDADRKAAEQATAALARSEALLKALQEKLAKLETERANGSQKPAAASAPRHTARALVIGNSRYASFGTLPNPVRDARAMAAKLRSFGIPTDLVIDAGRDELIQALADHASQAAGRDISILFYAGHGIQVDGVNYLIPVNMRGEGLSAAYIKIAAVSLNAALDSLPAKTRIIFLDACRDNPLTRSLFATRGGAAPGLAPVQASSGTLVAYATKDGATADDGDGGNSPYTTALLKHLDEPVDISLALRKVRQTVLQMTSGRQEPWEYGSLVGEQIILPLMSKTAAEK